MSGFEARPEHPEDEGAIHQLVVGAFGREEEAQLVALLRTQGHLHASSVITLEGTIVAHAALSRARVAMQEVQILAPVSVEPSHQGRGVGTAVVRHVLGSTKGPVVVLGDPGYYQRFGFEDAHRHGIIDETFPAPPGALQVLRPEKLAPGTVEYPGPFLTL